jgi:nucleoside-diphosphate-sugar epimerase
MSRIAVTGATGFIGRHIVARLLDEGHEVIAVGRTAKDLPPSVQTVKLDLLAPEAPAAIAALKSDILVHAAWVTAHGAFWTSPLNDLWADASIALARAFLDAGGRRIVGVGTCVEYDLTGMALLDEATSRLASTMPYGLAKDRAQREIAVLCAAAGASFAWCRLFHLYGPDENPQRLVPSVILSLLKGEEARTTLGTQWRDFMHAADAGHAIAHVASGLHAGAINIGSGQPITIAGLVTRLADMLGGTRLLRLGAIPLRPDDPASVLPRIERLNATGFTPDFDLETGLRDTISFWKATLSP